MVRDIINHLSQCARMLGRSRGYTLAVTGLLALGIGASTAIFGLVDAVLLRALPVPEPKELVRIVRWWPKFGARSSFPYAYYEAVHGQSTAFTHVFGEAGMYMHFALTDPAPPEQITVRAVTPEYFESLGVSPLRGRVLTAQDAEENASAPPAVLSYNFWKRRFHGNAEVVGQGLVINGRHLVIVGVLPRAFNGTSVDTSPDLRIPLHALYEITGFGRDTVPLELAGRLKPGVTRAEAKAQCLAIWQQAMQTYLRTSGKMSEEDVAAELERGVDLTPLERGVSILRDRIGYVLNLVLAAIALLLTVLCLNVAGLILARVAAHRRDIAIRLAIGATRIAITRQLLTENLLLTAVGAAGGCMVAFAATPLLIHSLPPVRDISGAVVALSPDLAISGRTFAFVSVLSLVLLSLLSVGPAIMASRLGLDAILRDVRSSGHWRGRQALLALQVALCSFALTAAALFVHTFQNLRNQEAGFDRRHVATFVADLTAHPDRSRVIKMLVERVRDLPGVDSVAISSRGVMRAGGWSATVAPAGERFTPADFMNSNVNSVSPGYFETMGMRLLNGRDFTPGDEAGAGKDHPAKVIVNAAFVRSILRNSPPLGSGFATGMTGVAGTDYEIIGVVSDAKYRSLREPIKPTFYRLGTEYHDFVLNVRTREQPAAIIDPIRKIMASLDPGAPFLEARTLEEQTEESTAPEGIVAALASTFGAIMALLVGVGIYGLLSYVVTLRRREIGIRTALGARPVQVARLIARQTLAVTAIGVGIGVFGGLASGSVLRSFLYGVSPHDPNSLLLSTVFVLMVAFAASLVPVLRALKIEPSVALREET